MFPWDTKKLFLVSYDIHAYKVGMFIHQVNTLRDLVKAAAILMLLALILEITEMFVTENHINGP